MALVILVRHAETTSNRAAHFGASEDVELTEHGEQQARELGVKLRQRFRSVRLFSSPYHRALQTAGFIAAELQLPIEILPGIYERDFGYLKGLSYDHIPIEALDPAWVPEGGESKNALQARVLASLDTVVPQFGDEQIVIVAHGAVIQSMCAYLMGTWEDAPMPGNCGGIVMRFEGGWAREFEMLA
jgi:broad specificity phosphatase PhoE